MSELTVRYVRLDDLEHDPANPKDHDLGAIHTSFARFGYVEPVVRDERTGRLVAGHGRTVALAQSMADGDDPPEGVRTDEDGVWMVPVVHGWSSRSDEDARAALVALNRTTELGGWHPQQLADLLAELAQAEAGLDGTGYDGDDLDRLLTDLADAVEDEDRPAPDPGPPPPDPITAPGDLWQVGPHRILCGDATDPAAYATLLDGAQADLLFTDPPYGVDVQERDMVQAEVRGRRTDGKGVSNDDLTGDALVEFLGRAFGIAIDHTTPGAAWYVCSPGGAHVFGAVLDDLGVWRQMIVWVKDRFVMGRQDYHYRHETIQYGWTPGAAHHFVDDRTQDTVWEYQRPAASPEHPTMKPVPLVERAIRNSSLARAVILDPFLGSGTTLVAAARTDRIGYGMEVDPSYVDVAVIRLAEQTGHQPVHAVTGEPFPADGTADHA